MKIQSGIYNILINLKEGHLLTGNYIKKVLLKKKKECYFHRKIILKLLIRNLLSKIFSIQPDI